MNSEEVFHEILPCKGPLLLDSCWRYRIQIRCVEVITKPAKGTFPLVNVYTHLSKLLLPPKYIILPFYSVFLVDVLLEPESHILIAFPSINRENKSQATEVWLKVTKTHCFIEFFIN